MSVILKGASVQLFPSFRSSIQFLAAIILSILINPAKAQESISIATGEWSPFVSESLSHGGFMSRIVTEAFALEGIAVKWGFFPWARAMLYAKNGKWHATSAWAINESREKDFWYSDPIVVDRTVFFHRKDKIVQWQEMDDLQDLKVGTTTSYYYGEAFNNALLSGLLLVEEVPVEEMNFKKLQRGKIDILPSNLYVGYSIIKKLFTTEVTEQITHSPVTLTAQPLRLLFSKKIAENRYFLNKFNAGLKKLKLSGKIDLYIQNNITPNVAPLQNSD